MEILLIALCVVIAYLGIGMVLTILAWKSESDIWIMATWGYTAYKLVQSIRQKQKPMKKPQQRR